MQKGMQKFHAAGVDYTVRLGLGALDEYEETYGENSVLVLGALDNPEASPTQYIRPLVSLFMIACTPRIKSREDARVILDEIGTEKFIEIMQECATSAFIGADDGEGDKDSGNGQS